MRGLKLSDPWTIGVGICLLCTISIGVLLTVKYLSGKRTMAGLLIDLELKGPNPDRYHDLRDAFVRKLPEVTAELKGVDVRLDYIHFTSVTKDRMNSPDVDFILLSPQGTPWYMYRGEAGERLDLLKQNLKELVLRQRKPVLGVCGGHQFLALAFGGTVGFIDQEYQGKHPEQYPREAVAERGSVRLQTLRDDPILKGVATFPGSFYVMESHYDEVKSIPKPFVNLARSDLSEAQLISIPGSIVYGTAFHPERGWAETDNATPGLESGRILLANFLEMVKKHKAGSGTW